MARDVQPTFVAHEDIIFSTDDKALDNLPEAERKQILRLRTAYWRIVEYPNAPDISLAEHIRKAHKVTLQQAYLDVRQAYSLWGNVKQYNKEFTRYRAIQMILRGTEIIEQATDKLDMQRGKELVAAGKALADAGGVNIPDVTAPDPDDMKPPVIEPTNDTTVAGIERNPRLNDEIKKFRAKYNIATDVEPIND